MQDLYEQITTILTGEFGVEPELVAPEATFESMELDSLDLVELGLVVDEELGVRIPDERFEEIVTVEDAVRVIGELLGADA